MINQTQDFDFILQLIKHFESPNVVLFDHFYCKTLIGGFFNRLKNFAERPLAKNPLWFKV